MLVLGAKDIQAGEDDELDIIVGLLDGEVNEGACRCLCRCRVLREGGEGDGGFVLDSM